MGLAQQTQHPIAAALRALRIKLPIVQPLVHLFGFTVFQNPLLPIFKGRNVTFF
jgi:hypothetical protein